MLSEPFQIQENTKKYAGRAQFFTYVLRQIWLYPSVEHYLNGRIGKFGRKGEIIVREAILIQQGQVYLPI